MPRLLSRGGWHHRAQLHAKESVVDSHARSSAGSRRLLLPKLAAVRAGNPAGASALRYVLHQVIHIDQEFQGCAAARLWAARGSSPFTITGPADSIVTDDDHESIDHAGLGHQRAYGITSRCQGPFL